MILAENKIQKKLFKVINESLALLKQASIKEQKPAVIDIPIPSLLDQCIELCEQHHAQTQEPIRMVHHFGLPLDSPLLSSLATLANTRVLKDIHPNNNSFKDSIKSQTVVPIRINTYDDAIINAEDDEYRIKVLLNDLQQTQQQSNQIGQRLLICDNHCLSQTKEQHTTDLLSLLKCQFTVRSLIVVTEPVDSYPVYCAEVKTDTPLLSFEEYCQSILDFIQANPDLTVIRHEDFVTEPERMMQDICITLELPYCKEFLVLGEIFCVKSDKKIDVKSENIIRFKQSDVYHNLCQLIGYDCKKISYIVDDCLNSQDVHEKIDSYLFSDNLNQQEKFQLCNDLSEYFYQNKDNLMTQHFVACAQDYLSKDIEAANKQKLLLSKRFIKYGRNADALDIVIQKLALESSLSDKETNALLNTYETLRASSKAKGEHGHEVLLSHLKKNATNYTENLKQKAVLIEIGTTRENIPGQGSTQKIAEYCKMAKIKFITVDMDSHNTLCAKKTLSKISSYFQAINMKGEDYLRNYMGKIDFIFLDAYDFDHGNHSELRQSRYEKFLGGRIDELQCHKMHLDCAKSVVQKLSANGVVCMDDTWLDANGQWCAKGTLAMPYFLENNFEVIEARNRSALLKRKSIN